MVSIGFKRGVEVQRVSIPPFSCKAAIWWHFWHNLECGLIPFNSSSKSIGGALEWVTPALAAAMASWLGLTYSLQKERNSSLSN